MQDWKQRSILLEPGTTPIYREIETRKLEIKT